MRRHQIMKVLVWGFGSIFLASSSALMFAAYFDSAAWVKVFGLILANSVIAMLIPVGFFGDDLDIPWNDNG